MMGNAHHTGMSHEGASRAIDNSDHNKVVCVSFCALFKEILHSSVCFFGASLHNTCGYLSAGTFPLTNPMLSISHTLSFNSQDRSKGQMLLSPHWRQSPAPVLGVFGSKPTLTAAMLYV